MGHSASSLAGQHQVNSLSREGGGIRKNLAEEKGGTKTTEFSCPGRMSSVISIDSYVTDFAHHAIKKECFDSADQIIMYDPVTDDSSDEDSVCEDIENDEIECASILAEAAALKKVAVDYHHPEVTIQSVDPSCFGRNYFNRRTDPEFPDSVEQELILAENSALKKLATDYHCPEAGIESVNPTCFGNNFFNRSSPYEDDTEERRKVLDEATALKKIASAFHHPENTVVSSDPNNFGRNFFSRPSAPEETDSDDMRNVLADAAAFKKVADDYHHPEIGVACIDPACFGRNFFNRMDGDESTDDNERKILLAEASALKKLAVDYHHPEVVVESVDPTCFGRNYFKSAQVDADREQILIDVAVLKEHATDYYHPEVGVESVDSTCFGRNYFNSLDSDESNDNERKTVFAEAAALKKLAADYHHPEVGVESVDSTCFGRNYFNSLDSDASIDDNERKEVIAEVSTLKKLAVDYHHPEVGVEFIDPTCFGRNYFKSAQVIGADREQILADASALKELATDYYNPEVSVESVDPSCFGRNYFNSLESDECNDNERKTIFAEASALKKLAADYHHPEVGVEPVDSTCFGRNYFNSLDVDESNDDNECKAVLAEVSTLKKLAVDYHHPEVGVESVDSTCFGRNYFKSAEVVDADREQVLADAAALKKLAIDYHQPEVGVESVDPTCFGRNYFKSAEVVDADHEQVLADVGVLKKLAADYHHPEVGVESVDSTCFGRNYFNSLDVDESIDDNERKTIFDEAAALKRLVADYHHPEVGVESVDSTCFGKNYFNSLDSDKSNDDNERKAVLAEVSTLKKLAGNYHYPEVGVEFVDPTCFGRNYFKSTEVVDADREQVLADASALKKLAIDYHKPEVGVESVDPTCFGRNYFKSAEIVDAEHEQVLADVAALKELAADYHHPEVCVESVDSTCFGRNYFNSMESDESIDDNERKTIFAEAAALKKLASDYHHPEVGVESVDSTCFGKNYFNSLDVDESNDDNECKAVLAEVSTLKKIAADYHHPEVGVESVDSTCFGRNYFKSAEVVDADHEQVLADAAALKKLAVDYHRPEVGVESVDSTCFGRNYFKSAEVVDADHEQVLADVCVLKKLAADYHHPEVGVESVDSACFGRNYFNSLNVDASIDDNERAIVLSKASALKKLAGDYHHPEVGVESADPTCFGRNYFKSTEIIGNHAQVDYHHPEAGILFIDSSSYGKKSSNILSVATNNHICYTATSVKNNKEVYGSVKNNKEVYGHFDFDEDMEVDLYCGLKDAFGEMNFKNNSSRSDPSTPLSKNEGNLSRSPSSVMLFDN